MQSRSDNDVDVFVLHGITPPSSVSPSSIAKSMKKIASTTPGTTSTTGHTPTSPTAADILSKLISDIPPPKHPKNFIVFAPVADTENAENSRKGRRFDSKVVVREEDLVAEESFIAEDISQEPGPNKQLFSQKRNPLNSAMHTLKPGMRPPSHKKEKLNKNPNSRFRFPASQPASESPPTLIKRPQRGESVTFPSSSKPPTNLLSNRNGGLTQSRNNKNIQQRNNYLNQRQNNEGGMQNFNKIKSSQDYQSHRNQHNSEKIQSSNFRKQSFQQSHPQQFHSMPSATQQTQEAMTIMDAQKANQYKKDNPRDNQRNIQGTQNAVPSFNPQALFESTTKHLTPNQQNFPSLPQNVHTPESSQGGPQYFAPPPQAFHTKISYDQPQPSSKFPFPAPPLSTYEKVAQSSVDTAPDGTHHHHHHHHHHEPVPANSDPVGDVNYSDADRLGTLGIGMSPSRGITLQIGGGGGGLGGLLPLGTLGIVRNIASALIPRPQLGLNSKVFLGVEVGKGGGLSVGLG